MIVIARREHHPKHTAKRCFCLAIDPLLGRLHIFPRVAVTQPYSLARHLILADLRAGDKTRSKQLVVSLNLRSTQSSSPGECGESLDRVSRQSGECQRVLGECIDGIGVAAGGFYLVDISIHVRVGKSRLNVAGVIPLELVASGTRLAHSVESRITGADFDTPRSTIPNECATAAGHLGVPTRSYFGRPRGARCDRCVVQVTLEIVRLLVFPETLAPKFPIDAAYRP